MKSNGRSSSRRWLVRFQITACALLVMGVAAVRPPVVFGQGATGAVNGTVTDSSGAVIPDAKVVLHNVATGTDREATTNGTGLYVFVEVLPGTYSIQISAQGFATAKGQSFSLNINQTATLNFALTIGPTVQEVTVAEAAAHLESTTAELGTAVASREVNELPLNGRNFTQLLTLTPGVSPISTAQNASGGSLWAGNTIGSFSFPSVNGQNNRANFFVLDGYNDQQSMLAMVGTTPIIDSVQEFKVQSHNDSSAYGFALGGIVNVATRSGTNQYHGDVWEFLRNNVLDANNYFNNAAGLPTVPYKQNQFGVVFGGPLIPGNFRGGAPKTWFFAGYEGFRSVRAASTLLNVPTAAELGLSGGFADLSGLASQIYNPWSTRPDPANPGEYLRDPFMCDGGGNPLPVVSGIQAAGTPCNRIPQSLIATNLVNYVATGLPAPVNTGVPGYNAIDTTPTRTRQDTANLRFDHEFSDRTSAWIRYTGFTQPDSVSVGYPGASTREYEHGYQGAVTVTHTFAGGAKVLTAGFSRNVQEDNEVNYLGIPTGLGLQTGFSPFFASGAHTANAATTGPMDPSIGITGYNNRPSTDLNLITTADVYEGKADFTWIHGAHTLGMGFDLNTDGYREPLAYDNDNFSTPQTSNPKSPAGTGSSLASMLLGVPDNAIYRNGIETDQHGWVDGFYAQDTWKVMRNLTVNIGLRYEFRQWPIYGSLKDNNQFVGDMDLDNGTYILARVPPACDAASGVGAPCIPGGTLPDHVVVTPLGNGRIYHNTYDNFSPRLGLAYQLRPTTVIRAAAVKFYDNWGGQLSNSQAYEGTWPSIGIEQNANLNYPTSTGALPTVTWDNPFSAGSASSVQLPAATPFSQVAWFVQPNGQNPYSEQWNFGVQQSFGSSTLLEADYVGSHSSRLDLDAYRNEALTPGPGDQAPRRPFPYITPTYYGKSVGKSNYEALQLRLRRTTSKGLTYIISYTWSKNINLGCDGWFGAEGCDITQIYNLKADRSVAGFDQPQMFVASWTYDLPFGKGKTYSAPNRALNALIGGWSLNGIYSLRSGEPFNLSVSGDIPNVGAAWVRPDVVGPKFNGARTPQHYFDTASFVVPQPYTFGNFGRNVLRQVWAPNFDMSVFRDFKLPFSETTRLQFRAEFFNTWNNVALGGCLDTTVQDPNFGSTTCTRNTEREIQFAMKFFF